MCVIYSCATGCVAFLSSRARQHFLFLHVNSTCGKTFLLSLLAWQVVFLLCLVIFHMYIMSVCSIYCYQLNACKAGE